VPNKSLTTEQVLTLLAATPRRIAALTAGLAPAQLHTTPNPGEWSANDVLAHLSARWLAGHERPHVKQVERIVNTMHL